MNIYRTNKKLVEPHTNPKQNIIKNINKNKATLKFQRIGISQTISSDCK